MKKIQNLQLATLAITIIFIIWSAQANFFDMKPLMSFSITGMAKNIFYPVLFILAGIGSFLKAIRILVDAEYTKYIVSSSPQWQSRFWGKVLGPEKAMKFYKSNASVMIIFAVALIIFGIVLFFL